MAQRKLQQEIDRTFKKVAEGIAAFESIFEKIQQTPAQAQKEKLEQELKKEIKKLQRHRDQIKSWIAGNEVKDKSPLQEQRKLIENQMERFKACEKEMKTKAYSKEGLSAAAKLDPREKEKAELSHFLSSMVEELERQIELAEAESEALQATMKKGRKDANKSVRLMNVEHTLERHKWHQDKLELMLRLLENGNLETDQVANIHEDIKYYVESNQDADFAEDENIYDELNLVDDDDMAGGVHDDKVSSADTQSVHDDVDEKVGKKSETRRLSAAKPISVPTTSIQPSPPTTVHAPTPAIVTMKPAPPPSRPPEMLKYASAAAAATSTTCGMTPLPPPPGIQPKTATQTAKVEVAPISQPPPAKISAPPQAEVSAPTQARLDGESLQELDGSATSLGSLGSLDEQSDSDVQLPPGLRDLVASFKVAKQRALNPPDMRLMQPLLEASLQYVPDTLDGETPRHYVPKNAFPTPPHYPQEPLTIFDNPALFEKIDLDTLFYVFYHQQGTYQQYLSAKELKKQSWRFHKKYLTWFQRHEEPKQITDDFEQGTYRYFDWESMWIQRRKTNLK